jgi:hypothetical protein
MAPLASDCKRFDRTLIGNLVPASCVADLADVLHPHQDRQKRGIAVEGNVDFIARDSWFERPRRRWQQIRNSQS